MKVISGKWTNVGIIVAWQSKESCLHRTKHLTLSFFFLKRQKLKEMVPASAVIAFLESCCRSPQVFSSCGPC